MTDGTSAEVSVHWDLTRPPPEEREGASEAGRVGEAEDGPGTDEKDGGMEGREEIDGSEREEAAGRGAADTESREVLDAVGAVRTLVLEVKGRVQADGAERAVWARKAAAERRRARLTGAGLAGALALGLLAGGAVGIVVASPPPDTTGGWRDYVWKVMGQEAKACLLSLKNVGPGWTCTATPAGPKQ